MTFEFPATPLEQVRHPLLNERGVELFVKREDLVHPLISGNKWYKLKYNLEYAAARGYSRVVSFGGAYSNHLHALAYAGQHFGIDTVGIIRGELQQPLNPTLQDAQRWGMRLQGVSRSDYRRRDEADYVAELTARYQPCYVIPEGGANERALRGCRDIVDSIDQQLARYEYLAVPCGTGATLAGLIAGVRADVEVLGFSALKGHVSLAQDVTRLLAAHGAVAANNWRIIDDYHFGGFAKITPDLVAFMADWQAKTGIAVEPVYTGKMLYGVMEMISQGDFEPGARIVAVHTGGMQGLRGMQAKMTRMMAG